MKGFVMLVCNPQQIENNRSKFTCVLTMAKKILLIDDDAKIVNLEKAILTQGGFEVDTALDGAEGLEKLRTGQYDVIVLDIRMPAMDGYEVARKIKQMHS